MNRLALILLAQLCLTFCANAQLADSLVYFNELSFSSEFERQAFLDVKSGKPDAFSLLIANGNLLTDARLKESKAQFIAFVNTIKLDDIKKNEKRIKAVHEAFGAKYLKKFEYGARFEQLFHNGYFSSISASAGYALAFDQLKIPYTIVEQEEQVYMIAYPQAEKIIIQHAPVLSSYFQLTEQFKTDYITLLKDQKLIDPKEYASSSLKDLFDKYYFGEDRSVTLVQLAALQYLADGLITNNNKKQDVAFEMYEKAHFLYPSERTGYLLMRSAIGAFAEYKVKDSVQASYLGRLTRYVDYGVDLELMKNDFSSVIQNLLFDQNARPKLDVYYRVLDRNIPEGTLKTEIGFLYQFHTGRYYYNLGKFREAILFLERALALKPRDSNCQVLLLGAIGSTIKTRSPKDVITLFEKYQAQFEDLKLNDNFNTMLSLAYLVQSYRCYYNEEITEGDKYRASFETFSEAHKDLVPNEKAVEQAYTEAAMYYFRKGQKAKAKQIINTGLKYAPESRELKAQQQAVK